MKNIKRRYRNELWIQNGMKNATCKLIVPDSLCCSYYKYHVSPRVSANACEAGAAKTSVELSSSLSYLL